MNNISLGKYTPYNTVIHRLDYRIKMLFLIVFMVISFLTYGSFYMTLVVDAIIFLIILVLTCISKSNFLNLFKSLKSLWFMIILLMLINFFIPSNTSGDIAFTLFNRPVYYSTILNLSVVFCRIILILALTTLYTSTSKPLEMTKALEWYLNPLKYIKIPVAKLAMALSLALRFIPTLFDDTNRIIKAQASRGVDFKNGSFKDKIKAITSLIIPLFISSFEQSNVLADALISRGYNPDSKRSKYKEKSINYTDIIFLVFLALVLALAITDAIIQFDIFKVLNVELPKLS